MARWVEYMASLVLSVVFQLKLETLPEMPVKYCRQPSGAMSWLEQEYWVILIFHCLEIPVPYHRDKEGVRIGSGRKG